MEVEADHSEDRCQLEAVINDLGLENVSKDLEGSTDERLDEQEKIENIEDFRETWKANAEVGTKSSRENGNSAGDGGPPPEPKELKQLPVQQTVALDMHSPHLENPNTDSAESANLIELHAVQSASQLSELVPSVDRWQANNQLKTDQYVQDESGDRQNVQPVATTRD